MSSSLRMSTPPVEFHRVWDEKMMRVSHAGLTVGMTILKKIRSSPAPSILAASRMESCTVTMNCFIRNSPRDEPMAGMISAR